MSAIRGFGLTTDDQLRELARDMGFSLNYVGFAETLPKHLPIGFNIINLGGPETNDQGTHWTMWYVDPSKQFSVYFDSYGVSPEDPIVSMSPRPLIINKKQVQKYNEEYCGIWALMCASFINKAKNKKRAVHDFVDRYNAV